jgi:hypothetical protein
MEIEALFFLLELDLKSFAIAIRVLRILNFKENHVIKKVYIEEIDKDRDELAASLSSNSSPRNSTIKHLIQPKTQLLSLISRV